MKKAISLLALASFLAAAGCAGGKIKSVQKEVPQVYESLPSMTNAERGINETVVYTLRNSLIRHNLNPSSTALKESISDLTAPIKKRYGEGAVQNPVNLQGTDKIYFLSNGNVFSGTDYAECIAKNINATEYKPINENEIIFVNNGRNSIKRINNGSIEDILTLSLYKLGEVQISSDGQKMICAAQSLDGSPKEYWLVNLAAKNDVPVPLSFKKTFGCYGSKEGPGNVSWRDSNKILFTYKFQKTKGTNIYSAELDGYKIIDDVANGRGIEQLTSEEGNITSVKKLNNGDILYVSDKSGVTSLYLLKDKKSMKLIENFNGENFYLANKR